MATETITESKTEAKPAKAKEEAVEENKEPSLKYKTWVLKVSVHCQGCMRKVKKILNNIEGVYTTDVDLRLQKVTVVGNVEADTLIKKLVKAGKHAELWPHQNADQSHKKKAKGKSKGKEKDKNDDHEIGQKAGGKEKETVNVEVLQVQDPSKASENGGRGGGGTSKFAVHGGGGGNVCKASESGETAKVGGQGKEVKTDFKQTVILPAGNQPPVTHKTGGTENEGGSEKSGGGSGGGGGGGGKKKKKKGHNGNNGNVGEGAHYGGVPAGTGWESQRDVHVQGQSQVMYPTNHSPPRYHGYHYPSPQSHGPPPAYAVSYHTTHPTTSYSASQDAPPYSYAYMHSGPTSEPPPKYLDSNPSRSSDSFELFSDENPNACSIM